MKRMTLAARVARLERLHVRGCGKCGTMFVPTDVWDGTCQLCVAKAFVSTRAFLSAQLAKARSRSRSKRRYACGATR